MLTAMQIVAYTEMTGALINHEKVMFRGNIIDTILTNATKSAVWEYCFTRMLNLCF